MKNTNMGVTSAIRVICRNRTFCRAVASVSATLFLLTSAVPAFAGSTSVLGGNAVLTGMTRATLDSNGANAAVFSSKSASAVLDWAKFNVGSGQSMTFNGASTTFFNLVDGAAGKSQIDGIINGSGNVWVINPAGIAFGANSSVNVGGLFAAAAGNVENAAALRAGTAMMPEFSSFAGTVDASKGSFTADQVALMGKTVDVNGGDFSGAKGLSIGAASEMLVDEVEGGRVSLNLNEFVEKTDSELDLGDLLIEEDVRVVTDGRMNVGGEVNAGSVYLKSGGDLNVKNGVTANVGNLQMITQDGDITVDKDVNLVAHGDGATLQVQAGQNEMTLDDSFNLVFSKGDVTLDGNLVADGENGTIRVFGGYNGLGGVQVNGSVESSGDVAVFTENGDISVAKDALIKSTGDGATIRAYSGISEYSLGGDIDIAGTVEATGANAQIDIESGYNFYTDGSLDVSGSILANGGAGTVLLSSGNGYSFNPGSSKVSGRVEADTISIKAYDKDVAIEEGANVKAGTYASLVGLKGVKSEGTLDAQAGILSVNGHEGDVSVEGEVKSLMSSFKATGSVDVQNVENDMGTVTAEGSSVVVLNKEQLTVSKATATDGNVAIGTLNGGINVMGEVSTAAKGGNVTIVTAMTDEQTGDVFIGSNGKVLAEQEGGKVLITAGCGENSGGNVSVLGQITANGSTSVESSAGSVVIAGEVDSTAGMTFLTAADGLTVAGNVSSAKATTLEGGLGSAMIVQGANVSSDAGSVFVGADAMVGLGGKIDAADGISVASRGGSVSVAKEGGLNTQKTIALDGAKLVSSAGNISAGEGLIATARGGDLNLNAEGTGVVKANGARLHAVGKVVADNVLNEIDGTVSGSGVIMQIGSNAADINLGEMNANGVVIVNAGTHGVTVSGTVVARDAIDISGSAVTVAKTGFVEATGEGSIIGLVAPSGIDVEGTMSAGTIYLGAEGDVHVGSSAALTASGTDLVNGYGSIRLESSGKILVDKGAVVKATAADAQVVIGSYAQDKTTGGVVVNGEIEACTRDHSGEGHVSILAENGDIEINGDARADGTTALMVGKIEYKLDQNQNPIRDENGELVKIGTSGEGSIRVNGSVSAVGVPEMVTVMLETVNKGDVEVTEKGKISSTGVAFVSAADGVTVGGAVEGELATLVTSERGDIVVNAKIAAEGPDGLVALQSGKDILFNGEGVVKGTEAVDLTAQGDLIQEDAHLSYRDGRLEAVNLRPAASGKEVELTTRGAIGQGKSNPFVVDGKVYAVSLGDMSLAAGRGRSLEGGNASSKVSVKDSVRFARDLAQKKLSGTVTLDELQERMANPSDFDDNALLYSEGNMSLYTAGQLEANSFVGAGGNMTVSAARFGDMSYLNAGGKLTINNVGKPAHPVIAYFESVDGEEPRINNQPNDMVIFVDGRLAGGNMQIINKFGATEAFPVSTPELKSEQGIFGNPVFLHGDLDVANPMAVGNVDYMLQEIPRLTLASDFPLEIDKSVNTAGLNPKDVYRFGQHPEVAEEKPPAEQEKEEKQDDRASSEKPAEPKVASL